MRNVLGIMVVIEHWVQQEENKVGACTCLTSLGKEIVRGCKRGYVSAVSTMKGRKTATSPPLNSALRVCYILPGELESQLAAQQQSGSGLVIGSLNGNSVDSSRSTSLTRNEENEGFILDTDGETIKEFS